MLHPLVFVAVFVLLTASARAYVILFRPARPCRPSSSSKKSTTCSIAVFLGSGGHTSESLQLLSALDFNRYTPRTYLLSEGDVFSERKAIELETAKGDAATKVGAFSVVTLPRARRVHQSLLTTPPTALHSLSASVYHVALLPALRGLPFADVILMNGPGTCVPVCMTVYLSRFFGLPSPKLIYVESFARVRSLSLSAKMVRLFVDKFIVQWPEALCNGPGEFKGWLI